MNDWSEYAVYYIEQLGGPDSDNAYHSLVEANDAIVPILINAFQSEQDPDIRSQLVEIIVQHRFTETVEFLSEVLNDPVSEVWKSALDGLVTIGGQSAICALEAAKRRIHSGYRVKSDQVKWIDEAIRQVREQSRRGA